MRQNIIFTDPLRKCTTTSEQLGLIISRITIGEPMVNTNLVEVPGADGALDYTDYFGHPNYRNRQITIECGYVSQDRFEQERVIRNSIHGKRLHICIADDPEYYWVGRVSVGSIQERGRVCTMTIYCDCQPYKLKRNPTVVKVDLTAVRKRIWLQNDRKPVIPRISVTSATYIRIGAKEFSLAIGEHRLLDLELDEGTTIIQANVYSGTGEITFEYQEASL